MLILLNIRRCYSVYEHSALHAISTNHSSVASSSALQTPSVGLPPDISIETILSVVFICVGLVLGAEELRPISWRVWAGKVERESGGGGPFQGLEYRFGFVDIRVGFSCHRPNGTDMGLRFGVPDLWANVFTQARRKDFADCLRRDVRDVRNEASSTSSSVK